MNDNATLSTQAHHVSCPQCRAELTFSPQDQAMTCSHCQWKQPIPKDAQELRERPLEESMVEQTQKNLDSTYAFEMNCPECGATVMFNPPQSAGKCSFCAASIIAQPSSSTPILQPDGLLPFRIDEKTAQQSFKQWIQKRWFAPSQLKKLVNQMRELAGIYLPYYTYDCYTITFYEGERGDHYTVDVSYTDSDGNRATRSEQRTAWHSVSGKVHVPFDDVLIAATESVPLKRLDSLEPWPLKEQGVVYNPSYLAGFQAERTRMSVLDGFERAQERMQPKIISAINHDIGGDEQRIDSHDTSYQAVHCKSLLLPIWIAAYQYQDKKYQVTVNGQTGEVQGERPYSTAKIIFFVLFWLSLFATAFLIYWFYGKTS